ncbi:MAG: hypothetical protein ABS36_15880 [Acidobacteria bacterium SCN 69-37]|nr:MAG: hypothetical protein ABS36_15880 [Acidobacteria bacterium SCN 69-37]
MKDESRTVDDRRNVLQTALTTIERLQKRIVDAERSRHEPIAIVGMACRLPGGVVDPDTYWRLLADGRDVVGEVPPDRWDVDAYYDPDPRTPGKARTKAGGFLDRIDEFDPGFFGMSPREANGVDPQQRLLLETTWEALEHAAIPADGLDGSRTGVFVGITSTDYAQRIDVNDPARSDIYLATGTALNAAAGRVSFSFGFRGPCMAIDTACSSSLVAIHAACQSLRDGESDLVVAGGVNAILSPDPFVLISKWGMLSPEGRCKTFDASADGFVRGEGCGLIVLERLSDATRHGRRILAVIRGSAINQDGRSSGLTVPNGLAQQEVVRAALAASRLAPTDVAYVEAHGTGTSLGDPIEVEALAAVYGEGRTPELPLELGSVKSNIGHLEAASGVASVIKLVLALGHHQLPASLHVRTLTPAVPWDRLPLRVSTALHDWHVPADQPRRAGVSAFGFSGMNAHVILEERPAIETTTPGGARPMYALPLSVRTESAMAPLATRYADHLAQHPEDDLGDVCVTAGAGRAHLPIRRVAIAADRDGMIAELRRVAAGDDVAIGGTVAAGTRHRVVFLFTGQGAQYVGMGRDLDGIDPVFTATLDRCAAVLDPLLGRPLRDVLFGIGEVSLEQTGFTQPALYAIEVALAATWRSWGIEPAVVIGHSVGEFAAAVVAGVISLENGARLIAARGRLMQALPAGGAMVSIQGDVEVVRREIAAHADTVSLAAVNAPDTVVISGAGDDVAAIAARLAAAGMRTQALTVSHAFHSPLMAPMIEAFGRVAADVVHAAPTLTWISTLTGDVLDWNQWQSRMNEYWTTHARQPVLYGRAVETAAALACDVFVEVGPHPTLIALARTCLGDEGEAKTWVPSLRRNRPGWRQMIEGAAQLYARGFRPDWAAIGGPDRRASLALPTYPFQRQRYLVPFLSRSRKAAGRSVHDLLGERLDVAGVIAQFERRVDASTPAWVADHRIASEVVMPLTAYLEALLAAARQVTPGVSTLDQVEVGEPMPLLAGQSRTMQVVVDRAGRTSRLRLFSRDSDAGHEPWAQHASCHAGGSTGLSADSGDEEALASIATRLPDDVEVGPFYAKLAELGVDFGPQFRAMRLVKAGDGEAIGEIDAAPLLAATRDPYFVHPAVLDACLHVSAVVMDRLPGADDGRMFLPIGVDRFVWFSHPEGILRSHARVRPPAARGDMLVFDVRIETSDGRPVARLEGLRCRAADRYLFRHRHAARIESWLYETVWTDAPLAATAAPADATGQWVIFDDGTGRAAGLIEQLRAHAGTVTRVIPSGEDAGDEAAVTIAPDDPEAYRRALATAGKAAVRGVISFWPLRVPRLSAEDVPGGVQRFGTEAALGLVQALADRTEGSAPRLWIVTAGSQIVDGTETVRLEQAPVAGLTRVAANEHLDLRIGLIDLDSQTSVGEAPLLLREVVADADVEPVAYRKGVRYTPRLERRLRRSAPPVDLAPHRLTIAERGTLENLTIEPAERRTPGPGDVEIRVRASGLNFRDVLSALGMYPGEIRHLGSDCAGEVVAVGEAVRGFAVGDRVVAMVEGAFASHAVTRWEFVAPLPAGVTFEQGAAIPTAYLTADITLNRIAKMARGQRVLIHSGAGGVGMAAIALARRAGAEIFATAGSPEKRALLRRLGVDHALDSRSTSFADDLLHITGGRGVDIVLNSLAGPLLARSFDCLTEGGVFLEIGKRGVWTQEQVAALGRGIKYHVVDCNDNARDTPELVGQIFATVLQDIASGALPWLPCTTFPFERAPDAFRYMAQARHVGRVVFRHPSVWPPIDPVVRPDATYVVTGGLRGIGGLAARWLADEGARRLVLVGRRAPDGETEAALAAMRDRGVDVVPVAADVSTPEGIARLMGAVGSHAIGGVIHAAGVLDDGLLTGQTAARLAAVMGPKADAAWRLHTAIDARGDRPDFFVMYSSMSAVLGAPGQANYVAANAFLDALAHHRREGDRPGLSIGWGAWSEVGMAARGATVDRAGTLGLLPLSPAEGVQALDLVVRDNGTQVTVAPIDWPTLAAQIGSRVPPVIRPLVEAARQSSDGDHGPATSQAAGVDLAALTPGDRRAQLVAIVRRQLATVLGLPGTIDALDPDEPFTSLGLDSLTAVELRNRMQAIVGRPVPATAAFEWPTIHAMADGIAALFDDAASSSPAVADREEMSL